MADSFLHRTKSLLLLYQLQGINSSIAIFKIENVQARSKAGLQLFIGKKCLKQTRKSCIAFPCQKMFQIPFGSGAHPLPKRKGSDRKYFIFLSGSFISKRALKHFQMNISLIHYSPLTVHYLLSLFVIQNVSNSF